MPEFKFKIGDIVVFRANAGKYSERLTVVQRAIVEDAGGSKCAYATIPPLTNAMSLVDEIAFELYVPEASI